jgi:hypothetical protein
VAHEHDEELTPDEAFEKLQATFTDLSKIDTSSPRPWVDGMTGFMRPGSRALWFGAKGEGKSMAALVASVDVVAAGGSVTYIDMENGRLRTAERLDSILNDRPADLREQVKMELSYADRFDFAMLKDPVVMDEARSRFGAGTDLLVIDSLPRILGRLGLNESEPAHVQQFVTTYIDPLVGAGAAVLALDNTGHSATGRPRGASSKEDLFELAYRVTGGQTCSPTKLGTIRLHRTRHRDGDEFVDLSLAAGAGTYGSIVADDGPAKLLQSVVGVMTPERQSKNAIYLAAKDRGVKIRKTTIFKLLPEWAQDPDSGIIEHDDGQFGLEP